MLDEKASIYDLIIIGAGPAGVTAAVYAARKLMHTIVLTDDIGGQTMWSGDIENYTGYQFITGVELVAKFEEHIKQYDVLVHERDPVIEFSADTSTKTVHVQTRAGKTYTSRTAIIASGKHPRSLGVPGEKEFRSRGVHYCATCDGPLFSKKDVAVIGGGNSALEAALQLSRIAHRVYLFTNSNTLTGDRILQKKINLMKNISLLYDVQIERITGTRMVEAMDVRQYGHIQQIPVSGVFIEIGLIPNAEFVHGISKNNQGEIVVSNTNQTSVPFVFAAGDVTDVPEKQIIIAAGEGAKACLSAFQYLAHHEN